MSYVMNPLKSGLVSGVALSTLTFSPITNEMDHIPLEDDRLADEDVDALAPTEREPHPPQQR